MATKKVDSSEITIMEVQRGVVDVCILGTTPLICNRMSQKVLQELLMPRGRKNAAEKASSMKHDPMLEFRNSPYTSKEDDAPTLIQGLATWFKRSMAQAAVDMPGAAKTQIGRLTFVRGERVPIYGVPRVMCAVTRSADMKRTPDVRTRAILPRWACRIAVEFTRPILREQAVVNLLASAGMTIGVGDWRSEKGSGNYGSFKLVAEDDPEFVGIVKNGGRAAQIAAMEDPIAHDDETSDLLAWFDVETKRRGFKVAA